MRSAAIVAAVLLISGLAVAGPCTAPTVVPADGRIVDFDFVPQSASNFYQFTASAGHSYSVEVRQDYDDVNADVTATLSGPAGTCPTPAALAGTNDTTAADPALPANATRVSFTAATSGAHRIQVANANVGAGRYISVSVSDTTAYNVRWSTFGTFITQWGFQNTTSQDIAGTLKTTTTLGGTGTNTISFVVPANSQIFKIIAATSPPGDISVGAGKAGFAVFTHNGPPGGILTDAFFINSAATVIVPSVFEPVRQSR